MRPCIGLTLFLGLSLSAAAPLKVREVSLGKPEPGTIPESFVASANLEHFGYVAASKGRQSVIIDGSIVGTYEGVGRGTPLFSPEGDSVAFVGITPSGSQLVVNGKASGPFEGIDRLRFSQNGRRTAFVAEHGKAFKAVVDGSEGPLYDQIGEGDPVFTMDGTRVAYAALRSGKWVLVENGKEGPAFDAVGRGASYFSRDGKTLVYLGLRNGKYVLVVNGLLGKEYDRITDIVVSTAGVIAFRAVRGADQFVVFDGREGIKQESVIAGSLAISEDGRHYSFAIKVGNQVRMVVDGADGAPLHEVGAVAFDSTGKRFAYKAVNDLDSFVVVDGKPGPPFSQLAPDRLTFSPDGLHLVYGAQKGARWHAVLDGVPSMAFDGLGLGTFSFSPDGARLAFWAKRGIRAVLVVDGAESAEYRSYLGRQSPQFRPSGSVVAIALKGDEFVRLEADPPP